MPYLANGIYLLLLVASFPYLLWQGLRHGKYGPGWREKLFGLVPKRSGDRPAIWLHAVSVGEVNLLASLVARLQRDYPHWQCVITVSTRAGYELACKKYASHLVSYAPLDFTWSVAAAFRRFRPRLVLLMELEVWPNLLRAARQAGVPVAIVNGRLSENSFRGYCRLRPLMASTFARIPLVLAQNEEYAARFRALGVPENCVRITGSLKFDNARVDRENELTRSLAKLAGFSETDRVLLAGSTQSPEESMALGVFRELETQYPHLRLVIVPRHPERFGEVAQLLAASGIAWRRRSQLASQAGNCASESASARPAAKVLLVDTVGELAGWWGTAHMAFVGGSMGTRGGQNMIEPAAYGAAVSFGPNTRNFRDVVEQLLAARGAVVVQAAADLKQFVARCLADPSFSAELGTRAQQLVLANQGAVDRTLTHLAIWLAEAGEPASTPGRAAA